MKKSCWAIFIVVCLVSAFPGVLNCQCVDANCGSVPKAIQTNVPQCHPAAAQTKGVDHSRKECCGKCRIEKAAVLSNEFSPVSDVRHRETLAEMKFFADFHSKIQRPSFFQGEFPEGPTGFFGQHILNTTFSFRAPPQG